MTGDAEFNEVFLTDVFVPAEHVVGIEGQGWTVAGSTLAHERGTNFPFKEQVVHEAYLARLYEEARGTARWTTRWWPMRWRRPTSISTCCGCTTCARSPNWEAARSRVPSKLDQAHVDDHDAGPAGCGAARHRTRPDVGRGGPWARQWLWSKAAGIAGGTSQVQRDIIAGRILGLPGSGSPPGRPPSEGGPDARCS